MQPDRPELTVLSPPRQAVPVPAGVNHRGRDSADGEAASLVHSLGVLWEGRWLILGALFAAALGLAAYLLFATPTYEADLLLQVEERPQNAATAWTDLPTALAGPQSQADTEIEVLRSRTLLESVVEELNLSVSVTPRTFPVVGRAISRQHEGPGLAPAFAHLSRFAWGGERVDVSRLDLEPSDDRTVRFTLVAGEGGRYALRDGSGETVLEGEVGKLSSGILKTAASEQKVEVFVRELRARPKTEFLVVKTPKGSANRALLESLRLAERGRKTGVISVSMEGTDPAQIATVLNTLAKSYLRRNVERRSADAERTLLFLDTQVPVLRENLYSAEAALENYKSKKGNVRVDLSLATKATLDRAIDLDRRLSEVEMQRMEMRHRFTDDHPTVQSLNEKVYRLRGEREKLNEQIQQLPEAESASLRLMRDVKVANELYLTLLNKAQELKVMKSGLVGSVQLLDLAATPDVPTTPKRSQAAAIALLAGLLGGLGLAFVRRALLQGIVDPAEAERELGVPVRAVIPRSGRQRALQRGAQGMDRRWPILAAVEPWDMSVEALRSLRTSLQFSLPGAPNRLVSIGAARPGVGKSFVTMNLASVFADAGTRVLVFDADLRKGAMHRYLGVERSPGMAELIAGTAGLDGVLHHTDLANIDFIASGLSPPNPSELLGSDRFRQILAVLGKNYDVVLVELPAILAVTDAALVARTAGTNLLVLRAGWHPIRELQVAVKQYAENGIRLNGLVFNDLPASRGLSRSSGLRYNFQYPYQ